MDSLGICEGLDKDPARPQRGRRHSRDALRKDARHQFLQDRSRITAPFLGQKRSQPQRFQPAHIRAGFWGPAISAQRRDGASATRDFCFSVLLRHLVLDLVCVPWVAAGQRAERRRGPAAFDHATAGLHLHVQTPLHAAHLHVLVQVPVHVTLGCGQLHLKKDNICVWDNTVVSTHWEPRQGEPRWREIFPIDINMSASLCRQK